ncbi:MAG: hypothetical protein JSU95_14535 [Betaproteobacteria bacterium]|nr:MAG: hypothetical protein JSU95_14535 [Betaproteobacteria bacterium]
MRLASFEMIAKTLEAEGVRYLIAGGLAVNAHGVLRFTKDLDLVIQLVPENISRAFSALEKLGYQPSVPVTASQFADAAQRREWLEDKGMQVLQFWSDSHRETPVDVFVDEPFSFEEEYERALLKPLYGTVAVRFVSLPTLIKMKREVGRPEDLNDIEQLSKLTDELPDE